MSATTLTTATSPTPTPETTYRYGQAAESPVMFFAEFRDLLQCGNSTLYSYIAAGIVPRPFSLGPERSDGKARRTAWRRADVYEWLEQQMAKASQPA